MGTFTGYSITTMRSTGRGADHFGKCGYCTRPASEHWHAVTRLVYQRSGGRLYLGGDISSVFGHEQCLRGLYPNALNTDELERDGSVRMLPPDWTALTLSERGGAMTKRNQFFAANPQSSAET